MFILELNLKVYCTFRTSLQEYNVLYINWVGQCGHLSIFLLIVVVFWGFDFCYGTAAAASYRVFFHQ